MKIVKNHRVFVAILLTFIGIILVQSDNVSVAQPRGVFKKALHIGLSADWFDPATAGYVLSANFPLYFMHDSLLKPMPEGAFTPCLAESWTVSSDLRVYEFKLRKGVKFHNGDTMTAEDVAFSFWRYKATQAKMIHGKTEKVEVINPHLIRFHFREPFPDFLEYLLPGATSIGWVVPKKYVEKVGDAGFKKHPIGAGPYKFVEFVPGVRLVGEAFDEYWRKIPNIKRMEILLIPETATRVAMVRRGEVDVAMALDGVFFEDVKKDPKLRLLQTISPAQFLVYIASQWDPNSPWSDPRVRKAASLAIDRQTLADTQQPGAPPIGSLGLKGDPLAVHFPADPYDPERAKKLLAEAGYPKGFHGGVFYPYQGRYWPLGEQVATYWKAIGITVETRLLDRPAWFANREGGKMKGAIFVDPSPAPMIGLRLLYLFGPTSYGNYPDIQALWDRYQKEVSPVVRKDLITQIQRLVYERTMWIPLLSIVGNLAAGPKLKGNPYKVEPFVWFTVPFEDIELEK